MFLISMAGLSSRFFEAGYTEPKYSLPAFGQSLFALSLRSFEHYFASTPFLFVTLKRFAAADFVRSECRGLGIRSFKVVELAAPTRGQAETVFEGIAAAGCTDQAITIFNIDTAMPGFRQPDVANHCDGYLDVFVGDGANWSYARTDPPESDRVVETAEKNPISNLCSTGLYHFASSSTFSELFRNQLSAGLEGLTGGEVYVAPLYNQLIAAGGDVRCRIIDRSDVVFFGTPAEYEALLEHPDPRLIGSD